VNEQKEVVYFQQLVEEITLALGDRITRDQVTRKADFIRVANMYTLKSYLYNIFYNLIINSINFKQPARHPVIEIASMPGDLQVKLLFKDNGRGIDLARHGRHIFGLYQRFDMSVEGRGMGLCMVKTQVQTLGGTITVESEVNRGTVFSVQLPV
jgi:light-regulated signal transduction histidine kinase (bacteriophytochrome)